MRRPNRGLSLPAPRTWFLALVFAVAAFAILNAPEVPGGPGHLTPPFWPTSSKAYAAATDYFLNVDGIPGDATAEAYVGQIIVNQWQFAISHPVVTGVGGSSAGKVECSEFTFGKLFDISSPKLFEQSLAGESIAHVVLTGTRTATAKPIQFLRISFTNVLVSGYFLSSGGDRPTESVSLNYGTITVEYRPQNADGSFAPPAVSSWNCLLGRPVDIVPTATTTTLASSAAPTYGSLVTLTASVTSTGGAPTGTVAFSAGATMLCPAAAVSGGSASCATSALAVGPNRITGAFTSDAAGFGGSSGTLTVVVAPAILTVTASSATKVYGAVNPPFAVTFSGFANGDTAASLSGVLGFTTSVTAASAVGSYGVTPNGLTSSNYAITFAAGTLTVTPAPLLVAADNATKVYGAANPPFTVTYTGLVNGDTAASLGGALAFATSATAVSGVGSYDITPSGLTSANYTINFAAGTLTVTPAPLTVAADNTTKVYGTANPPFTVTYTGFVNGDTAASLGGALAFATAATAASGVGGYDITPSGLTSSNYTITFGKGTLSVTPASLTITADDKTKVYGQANPTFTVSFAGFVKGDSPSSLGGTLSFATNATAGSPVGSYSVTPSGLTSTNYNITFLAGNLGVTPAPLTVTADATTKVYGAANPAFAVSYSGFVNGDGRAALGGTLSFATAATAASPVGSYSVTPSGLTSPNYAITFVAGPLTVTPAPLTVTADGKTKLYGAANPPFTVGYAGFVNGDGLAALGGTLGFATTATAASPVGSYPITPSGLTSANYTITFVSGTLTVTPAPLTITADSKARPFGTPNPTFTASFAGFVNGDAPGSLVGTLAFATPATTTSPVGNYPITVSGLTSANYAITYQAGILSVTPAIVTLTLEADLSDFDEDNVVRLEVTASPTVLAGSTLTGTVRFYRNGKLLSGVHTLGPRGIVSRLIRLPEEGSQVTFRVTFTSSNPNFASAEATITVTLPSDSNDDSEHGRRG